MKMMELLKEARFDDNGLLRNPSLRQLLTLSKRMILRGTVDPGDLSVYVWDATQDWHYGVKQELGLDADYSGYDFVIGERDQLVQNNEIEGDWFHVGSPRWEIDGVLLSANKDAAETPVLRTFINKGRLLFDKEPIDKPDQDWFIGSKRWNESLTEKRESVSGVNFLIDPTPREFVGALHQTDESTLRGFLLNGHTWWWDATHAYHMEAILSLGYTFSEVDAYLVASTSIEGLTATSVSQTNMSKQVGPIWLSAYKGGYHDVYSFAGGETPFSGLLRGLSRQIKESDERFWENPTARQMTGILNQYGECRGFIDLGTGNYFVWPSADQTHGQGYMMAFKNGYIQKGSAPVFFMISNQKKSRADTQWTVYMKPYGQAWIGFHPVSEPSPEQKGERWAMLLRGLERLNRP